jgi:hypothetical protein
MSTETVRRAAAAAAAVEEFERRILFSTYVVTGASDAPGTVTPAGSGRYVATTLRAAVTAANAQSGADVIMFAPAAAGTIALRSGELVVSDDLTIQGLGANAQSVDGGGASRVFDVRPGVTASINDLTVANGRSQFTGGGGIRNEGTLALRRVSVVNNTAADADGGGVFNVGSLSVLDSTFSGNTATSGGGLFNGGAATVVNSTFAGNTADFGGGLYNRDGATLLVANSTVSGNRANQRGGGIASPLNDPVNTPPGTRLNNTIVAGNTFDPSMTESAANPLGPDLYGFFDGASSNNLVGSLGFAKGLDPAKNRLGSIENQTPKIDPLLSSLAYYGGTTQTMPPRTGSPAIDAGNNALVPAGILTDQRGLARIAGARLDIGSVETAAPTPPPPTGGGTGGTGGGSPGGSDTGGGAGHEDDDDKGKPEKKGKGKEKEKVKKPKKHKRKG